MPLATCDFYLLTYNSSSSGTGNLCVWCKNCSKNMLQNNLAFKITEIENDLIKQLQRVFDSITVFICFCMLHFQFLTIYEYFCSGKVKNGVFFISRLSGVLDIQDQLVEDVSIGICLEVDPQISISENILCLLGHTFVASFNIPILIFGEADVGNGNISLLGRYRDTGFLIRSADQIGVRADIVQARCIFCYFLHLDRRITGHEFQIFTCYGIDLNLIDPTFSIFIILKNIHISAGSGFHLIRFVYVRCNIFLFCLIIIDVIFKLVSLYSVYSYLRIGENQLVCGGTGHNTITGSAQISNIDRLIGFVIIRICPQLVFVIFNLISCQIGLNVIIYNNLVTINVIFSNRFRNTIQEILSRHFRRLHILLKR